MVNKKIVFLFVLIIVLAGFFYYLYKSYEPLKEQYFNVSISAIDKGRIKTGYEIINLGISGNTSETYETLSIPEGLMIITNRNLEGQNYYENEQVHNITGVARVDLILEEPELPSIKVEQDKNIIVDVYSKNFQEVDFCLKGSINYLFVRAEPREMKFFNLTDESNFIVVRTDKYEYENYPKYYIISTFEELTDYPEINLQGFENYDVCYDGEFSLKNNNKILNISYTKMSLASSSDYINLTLIDKMGNMKSVRIK